MVEENKIRQPGAPPKKNRPNPHRTVAMPEQPLAAPEGDLTARNRTALARRFFGPKPAAPSIVAAEKEDYAVAC